MLWVGGGAVRLSLERGCWLYSGEVDDRVQEAFEHKRDPVELASWLELKAATIAGRIRKGLSPSETLRGTGILMASVITDSDDHGVITSTRGVEYALYHQLGAPKAGIPQRRFAGISLEDAQEFEDTIRNYILNG